MQSRLLVSQYLGVTSPKPRWAGQSAQPQRSKGTYRGHQRSDGSGHPSSHTMIPPFFGIDTRIPEVRKNPALAEKLEIEDCGVKLAKEE